MYVNGDCGCSLYMGGWDCGYRCCCPAYTFFGALCPQPPRYLLHCISQRVTNNNLMTPLYPGDPQLPPLALYLLWDMKAAARPPGAIISAEQRESAAGKGLEGLPGPR